MKIISTFMLLLIPIFSYANELKIQSAQLTCLDKENGRYQYGISLTLKNTSKNKTLVITKTNGTLVQPEYNGKPAEISIVKSESKVDGVIRIPTHDELGLVTLHSGGTTLIKHNFSSKKNISSAIIEYSSTNIYDGRFKHWVGRVRSNSLNTKRLNKCKQ